MTMYPAAADHPQNLMKKKKKNSSSSLLQGGSNYGSRRDPTNCASYNNNYNYDCFISLGGGGRSNVIMAAEDESRTTTENISSSNEEEEEEATGSSSKVNNNHKPELINKLEKDGGEAGWLQLSLGSSGHQISLTTPPPPPPRRRRLLDLDLLPPPPASSSSGGGGGGETWSLTLTPPPPQQLSFQIPEYQAPAFFLQPHKEGAAATAPIDLVPGAMTFTHHQQQQYDNNSIPFRLPYPNTTSSLSLDQRPPPSAGSSSRGSFHFHNVVEPPPLCMDLRVVDPPPRLHSGVWFILQASQNQTKQPYLPQVPKNYLRIKDDMTTVRLLIKYLVNKLKLDREFEIEITCKGQQLLPFLTLQHVRDNIWNNPRRNDTVFPHFSATIDHLMVLNYGRIA